MIEIPIGKALIAVEAETEVCEGCSEDMLGMCENCNVKIRCVQCVILENGSKCRDIKCNAKGRKDGKNVIFKLVDINSHYIDGTIRKPIRRESDEQL